MSTSYPSNLSDAEWACLQRHLPPLSKRGRPPIHSLRSIFDAIFYVLRTGCPWRYLPANFPPWQTVFYHFRRLRLKGTWFRLLTILREAERERVGKKAQPSAAIIDAASASKPLRNLPGSVASMHISISRAASATFSWIPLVFCWPSTSRLPICTMGKVLGARLSGLAPLLPRLKKIWADAAYRGQELAAWCQAEGGWELEVVERQPGTRGFSVVPRRWVVENTQTQDP